MDQVPSRNVGFGILRTEFEVQNVSTNCSKEKITQFAVFPGAMPQPTTFELIASR